MPFKRTLRIVEILGVFKRIEHRPKKVLDFGYGDGQITYSLFKRGYDIIGLDVSRRNFNYARNSFPECDFRLYNGLDIPFEDHSFDTVILNDVLEHIPYLHMENIIERIKRVIKPYGIIYISVTNKYNLIEPHSGVPLVTWLPRIFWYPIQRHYKKKSKYLISDIYPYTFKRLKSFCKKHKLEFIDFTSFYVSHKFSKMEYIGNNIFRYIIKLLKKIKLINLFYYLAYKFSQIIFVCKVIK